MTTERDKLKRPCRCRCACQQLTLYGRCNRCLTGEHMARRRREQPSTAAYCTHPDHFSPDRARMLAHPCAEVRVSDVPYAGDALDLLDAGEREMLRYQRESR